MFPNVQIVLGALRVDSSGTPVILIVEDDALIALDIETTLACLPLKVVGHAPTGEAGHEMALRHQPDLILKDIHLGPRINGIEAAIRIHHAIRTRIVFLSANLDDKTLATARQAGMHGHLSKPFEDVQLKRTVSEALAKAA